MRADLRLGQIRSGQMKKYPPRSESDPLKVHISEIITALVIRSEMTQPPIQIEVKKLGTIFKQRLKKGLEWLSLSARYKPHFYL